MHFRSFSLAAFFIACMFAAGCTPQYSQPAPDPQEAFDRGMELYERGRYAQAIPQFRTAFNLGRASEVGAAAQLYLARAHAGNKEYILAASEFSRFSELYRTDPRREQAEYERALAYYAMSPGFELDQSETERAIRQFQDFILRFPTSELVAEAEARIIELREKMARKQFEVGRLYDRRELYEAAALAYEGVFDQFPETEWADDALVSSMESYINYSEQSIVARRAERLQKAVENYRRLVQVFPDSPYLARAQELNDDALRRIQELGVKPETASN
jgi:outer membrane protein assembly factor BamD